MSWRSALSLPVLLVGVVLSAATALGESGPERSDRCHQYAKQAAREASTGRGYWCDRADTNHGRWSDKEEDHYDYCMSVTAGFFDTLLGKSEADLVNEEARKREDMIDRCRACYRYAGEATYAAYQYALGVAAHPENPQCTLAPDDPRWGENDYAHFDWCEHLADSSFPKATDGERDARNDKLRQCPPAPPSPPPPKRIGHAKPRKLEDMPARDPVFQPGGSTRRKPVVTSPVDTPCLQPPCSGTESSRYRVPGPHIGPPSSKVLGSGLLENDKAASPQGPAAVGVPGASTGGGGGSLRGSTYSR